MVFPLQKLLPRLHSLAPLVFFSIFLIIYRSILTFQLFNATITIKSYDNFSHSFTICLPLHDRINMSKQPFVKIVFLLDTPFFCTTLVAQALANIIDSKISLVFRYLLINNIIFRRLLIRL